MNDVNENEGSSFDSEEEEEYGWVKYFLSNKGNEFFCEIDPEYLKDAFNLVGLSPYIPYYEYALDLITDREAEEDLTVEQRDIIEADADNLYGLIHARYILTNRGLQKMKEKYQNYSFGTCYRVLCTDQGLLPIGSTDVPDKDYVKLYCPRCEEIYKPPGTRFCNTDGAFFGTTFPHLFFLVYPELQPKKSTERYVPRVFGFKLHESSHRKALAAKEESQQRRNAQHAAQQAHRSSHNAARRGG